MNLGGPLKNVKIIIIFLVLKCLFHELSGLYCPYANKVLEYV